MILMFDFVCLCVLYILYFFPFIMYDILECLERCLKKLKVLYLFLQKLKHTYMHMERCFNQIHKKKKKKNVSAPLQIFKLLWSYDVPVQPIARFLPGVATRVTHPSSMLFVMTTTLQFKLSDFRHSICVTIFLLFFLVLIHCCKLMC